MVNSRDCSGPRKCIAEQSLLGLKCAQLLGEHFIEDCSRGHSPSPTEHSDPFALISGAQQGAIRNFDLWQAIPMVAIFPVSIASPHINRAHPARIIHIISKGGDEDSGPQDSSLCQALRPQFPAEVIYIYGRLTTHLAYFRGDS